MIAALHLMLVAVPSAWAQTYSFPTTTSDAGFFYPTAYFDHGGVTDWACGSFSYSGHRGSDYGVGGFDGMDEGRDVIAAAEGTVVYVNDGEFDRCTTGDCAGGSGFGNYVKIEHPDGKTTYYAHMKQWSVGVSIGQQVGCGTYLGQVGSSGYSTGPHLHFEPRSLNVADDPFLGSCSPGVSWWTNQGSYGGIPAVTCAGASLECEPVGTLGCGDRRVTRNDAAGSTNQNTTYGCSSYIYTGPELAWSFTSPVTDIVTLDLTGMWADLDLYVLDDPACDGNGCVAASTSPYSTDESVVFTANAGQTYTVVVDGWEGAVSDFALDVTCSSAPADFCDGLANGWWCDGDELVTCSNGTTTSRETCSYGCTEMPPGVPDECAAAPADPVLTNSAYTAGSPVTWTVTGAVAFENVVFLRSTDAGVTCPGQLGGLCLDLASPVNPLGTATADGAGTASLTLSLPGQIPDGTSLHAQAAIVRGSGGADSVKSNATWGQVGGGFCEPVPDPLSPTAPTQACNFMDWNLSPDGFYLISRFGTDTDPTTWGHTTTCGYLQGHYDYWGCRYDIHAGGCLDTNDSIPWVQGHVDWIEAEMLDLVDQYAPGDVPAPHYFYVAGAQRFGCGAVLRVSNPANGSCVVAYAEDGGPGVTYEGPDYGGRRILDASPAVSHILGIQKWGWLDADMVMVEWGQPGDVPGQACAPCGSSLAEDSNVQLTPWDPNHMQSVDCR